MAATAGRKIVFREHPFSRNVGDRMPVVGSHKDGEGEVLEALDTITLLKNDSRPRIRIILYFFAKLPQHQNYLDLSNITNHLIVFSARANTTISHQAFAKSVV